MILIAGCTITPEPITTAERVEQAAQDREKLFVGQQPVAGPISLAEAMARAIKYNTTQRLRVMEEALAQRQVDVSRYDLLPRLGLDLQYQNRNNQNASSSRSLETQRQSLEPSYSQDRDRKSAQLELVWNVLDFGISYYTAQQQTNRQLIAQQKRRKVIHDLMQDVRDAYWKAVSAQQLGERISEVRSMAEQALEDARAVERERLQPLLQTLRYQKALLDVIQKLETLEQDLSQAKPRLAALMNLPFGEAYALVVPTPEEMTLPVVDIELPQMEALALVQRPELIEAAYEQRITALETRKAITRLLPGLEFDFGVNFNSNSFLSHQTWYETGLRITWNLLSLPGRLEGLSLAETQEQVAEAQRLAVSMAVLSQVHLSYRDFQNVVQRYERARQLLAVEQRILENVSNTEQALATSPLETIRTQSNAMLAELRRLDSYAALQAATGRLHASLGLDPLPPTVQSHSVADLSVAIEAVLADWSAGNLRTESNGLAEPDNAPKQ
ncbi:MAG: TolC family protein [Pseudomonadota bacterium]